MRDLPNGIGAGTTELHVFRPIASTVLPEYVYIYLKSPNFVSKGIPRMTGTAGQKRVPNDYFAHSPFPLPPLAEQHRIVARVDALMGLCDQLEARQTQADAARRQLLAALVADLLASPAEGRGEASPPIHPVSPNPMAGDASPLRDAWERLSAHFDHLLAAPEDVATLRQTILQLAVQGRLVEQNPQDEPAGVLLERIHAVRASLIADGQINKPAPLPIISESEYPFAPLEGWQWERLGNLTKFIDYRGHTPPKTSSGVRLITAKNVRMGHVNIEPQEYISEETYKKWMVRGFPRYGDVLFTTEAPLANVAQLLFHEKIALAQRVINLQSFADLDSTYLKLSLMSPLLQDAISDKSSGMTATGIKASRLKLILIPLPPLAEQRRIVARVEQLMGLCDELEAGLREAQAAAERLSEGLCAAVVGQKNAPNREEAV